MIEMTIANAGLWRTFANMVAPGASTLATHGRFSKPATTWWISGTGSNRTRNRQSGSGRVTPRKTLKFCNTSATAGFC